MLMYILGALGLEENLIRLFNKDKLRFLRRLAFVKCGWAVRSVDGRTKIEGKTIRRVMHRGDLRF